MKKLEDPRLAATRSAALEAALDILQTQGVLAVTHASINSRTGISRSTLYRHWPQIELLRDDAFKRAASPPVIAPRTNGPLHADLMWLLGILMSALNETPWGKIAPQVIAGAATDEDTRSLINGFMRDRMTYVRAVFEAARERGELAPDAPIERLVETAIALPYFRKLVSGLPLDPAWLEEHVDMICSLAQKK